MSVVAVVAFGSNLGDRAAAIESARAALDAHPRISVVAMSPTFESPALKPNGIDTSAPAYLNAVALVQTDLGPHEILVELMRIETDHGRVRTQRWGDRTLDLDLIAFDDLELASDDLTLPHPRAHERDFVLIPWSQVQPEARLAGRTVVEWVAEVTA